MKNQEKFRVFEVYESVKNKSDAEKDKALKALQQELGDDEFHRQMFAFADDIADQQQSLQQQVKEIQKTPDWLFEDWIKMSEICLQLYGSKDNSATGKFTQKRNGQKKWNEEELQKLEEIRQKLSKRLTQLT